MRNYTWILGSYHYSFILFQDLGLTRLSCLGLFDPRLLCTHLPHWQKPYAVSFCSISIPHEIIWQMHLFLRHKEGLLGKWHLNGDIEENRNEVVTESWKCSCRNFGGWVKVVMWEVELMILNQSTVSGTEQAFNKYLCVKY